MPWGKDGPSFAELVQQALSGTSRGYDLLAPKFEATTFCTPESVIATALADLGEIDDALDLCTGTGTALGPLRERTNKEIVGVDFSEGMLEVARRKVAAWIPPPDISLYHRDIFEIEAVEQFDLVTCFGALGHIEEEREPAFLKLVRRALRPRGRFVFLTADAPPVWSRRYLLSHAFNAAMRVRNAIVSPPFVMYYLTFLLPDIERHLRWHGFEVTVGRGLFEAPYGDLVRVVATKK